MEIAAKIQCNLFELEKVLISTWITKNGYGNDDVVKVTGNILQPVNSYYSAPEADHRNNIAWLKSQAKPIPKFDGYYYAENKTGILIYAVLNT